MKIMMGINVNVKMNYLIRVQNKQLKINIKIILFFNLKILINWKNANFANSVIMVF